MNTEDIRVLAEIVQRAGLTRLKIKEGELTILIERQSGQTIVQTPFLPETHDALLDDQVVDFNRLKEVRAPMVGVFYPAPSPGTPAFIQRGDQVKKGDVLCIIEAMKMMNEITADEDGVLVDICAGEGELVEFNQILFKYM